jgi:PASTA domain-containing protein
MPSFEIPDGPTSVVLKHKVSGKDTTSTGSATFSVTNKVGSPTGGRLSVVPEGNAKAEWFQIQGEKERTFQGSETQKITVNVNVPGNLPPGDYKLRCRVVNVTDPDNDYTNSAVVTVTVPQPEKPPAGGPPWWIWLIVGGVVLLIIIGVVLYFVLSPAPPAQIAVPDVVSGHLSYVDAAKKITDAGLVAKPDPNPATSGTPNTVVNETPAAGSSADPGATVVLTVAGPPATATVMVPDVSSQGYKFDVAQGVLIGAGLKAQEKDIVQGKPPGTVYDQDPKATNSAPKDSTVTLTVDPGVVFNSVTGATLGSVISYLNSRFAVAVTVNHDGQTTDLIYQQTLNPGTYAKGTALGLTVHGALVKRCFAGKCVVAAPSLEKITGEQYLMQRKVP